MAACPDGTLTSFSIYALYHRRWMWVVAKKKKKKKKHRKQVLLTISPPPSGIWPNEKQWTRRPFFLSSCAGSQHSYSTERNWKRKEGEKLRVYCITHTSIKDRRKRKIERDWRRIKENKKKYETWEIVYRMCVNKIANGPAKENENQIKECWAAVESIAEKGTEGCRQQ